jgi:hypothetical protein
MPFRDCIHYTLAFHIALACRAKDAMKSLSDIAIESHNVCPQFTVPTMTKHFLDQIGNTC